MNPVSEHVRTYIKMVMAMSIISLMKFMKLSLDIHILVGVIALLLHKHIIQLLKWYSLFGYLLRQ